jgi:hypothetical protein
MRSIRRLTVSGTLVLVVALGALASAQSSTTNWFWGTLYHFNGVDDSTRQAKPLSQTALIDTVPLLGDAAGRLVFWNQVAIDASGLDHTPVQPGETRQFGEQLGPGRAARAMAIVHIAMHDSVAAITGIYRTYTTQTLAPGASLHAAIAQSAHDTLAALFPSQRAQFAQVLQNELAKIPALPTKPAGIAVGRRAAAAILALRANDGSDHPEPVMDEDYVPDDDPGVWRQDPISQVPIAMGANWGHVTPFVMRSAAQFRAPVPPAMTSARYTAAYNEVKRLGGDGITTPTSRTPFQTFLGIFWAYDGTPSLCAPPRLYNQITTAVAATKGTDDHVAELARLYALVNIAMADAGIAVWESKFFYNVWRPVGGVRESDPGTGPTGLGDGNPRTVGDPTFTPLGAPASNLVGPNFTPPFPAYPSGHAGIGAALFQTLRRYYRSDAVPFRFVSDEFNGETRDNQGNVRPLRPREFTSFSQAEEENGQSRIYLGIHWEFDKTAGIAQGRKIGNYVFDNALRRVLP